jgi:hypothetical protein
MLNYFGAVSMKIYTLDDFASEKDIPHRMDEWNNVDLVFYDKGNGNLKILKDNTSYFSVSKKDIQG